VTTQKGQKVDEEICSHHKKMPMGESVPWTQEMFAPPFFGGFRQPVDFTPPMAIPDPAPSVRFAQNEGL
jgi:hypothetical protein